MQDLSEQAEKAKRGGRSRRAESKGNTASKSSSLTDRNDYPQNSNCDVVTYEVVITRSFHKQKEKKNKQKSSVPKHPPDGIARKKQVWCIMLKTNDLHNIQAQNTSDFTLECKLCKWNAYERRMPYKCFFSTRGDKCNSREDCLRICNNTIQKEEAIHLSVQAWNTVDTSGDLESELKHKSFLFYCMSSCHSAIQHTFIVDMFVSVLPFNSHPNRSVWSSTLILLPTVLLAAG